MNYAADEYRRAQPWPIPAPEPRNWYADYVARWRMSPVNFGYRFGTGVHRGLR